MADKYIGDITKKTTSLTDYLVAIDGADAYQALVSDVAKKIIEEYQGSNLGGVVQSIQAGFNVVGANNIVGANNRQGWTALTSGQNLNSVTSAGIYYANSAGIYNSVLNSPMTGKPFRLDVQYSIANNSYLRQIWTANTGEQFIRESINIGSTWSEWRLTPTRAEVNAIAKALNQYTFVPKNATNMDFYNNFSASMPNNTYYRDFVANSRGLMNGFQVMLEGMKTTNDYEWQRVTAYFTDLMMIRRKWAGTWEEWKTVVN